MHTSFLGLRTFSAPPAVSAIVRTAAGMAACIATGVKHAGDLLASWHDRAQQRRTLASLDPRMLSDCAIDPATADAESRRPFWRYY